MAKLVTESRRDQYAALIAGVVFAAALIWAQAVIIPLVIALLLMFILSPAVMALQRRGLRRTPAVLLVMGAVLAGVFALLFAIASQMRGLASDLPNHKDRIVQKLHSLSSGGPGIVDNLVQMFQDISADLHRDEPSGDPARPIAVQIEPPKLSASTLLPEVARRILNVFGSIGLVLGLATSMLFTREDLRNRLIRLMGHGHLIRTTRALEEASSRISAYLGVQVMLNAGYGLAFGLGLAVLQVPYAFLGGVLAAVLRFIPFIGTWLAGAFPLVVSIAEVGWGRPIGVVVLVVVLGFVVNSVIEPRLVSRRTGVSGIALVVSATFWTWLWGPIGLILATPMTVCLAVLGKHVPGLEFLDVLLGTGPVLETHLGFYQRLLARDEGEAAELLEKYLDDHPPLQLYDEVLVPTLVRAQEDLERGHVRADDLDFIVKGAREVLHELPQLDSEAEAGEPPAETALVPVVGFAPHDEREELALEMLGRALVKAHGRMELVGSKAVTAEMVSRVEGIQPAVVCIVTLAPVGVAKARFLCKRLRARFPDLKIVVGHWGAAEKDADLVEQLRQAGATQVTGSLRETAEQVAPLLQVEAANQPAPA